jgi:hypothetical protein
MIYKVNLKSPEMMGYGALYNLKYMQSSFTNAPNPSYLNWSIMMIILLSGQIIDVGLRPVIQKY